LYFIVKKIPSGKVITKPDTESNNILKYAVSSVIVIILATINIANVSKTEFKDVSSSPLNLDLDSYKCENQSMGIMKLEKEDILMYIKPAVSFYSAEHSPIICWRGTGYEIENESIISVDNMDLNFCTLNKGKDKLYSVWWYDSGDDKTNSQFRWRTQNLFNQSDYRLVNVISHDKKILIDESKILLKKKIF
jgi:exosortase N